MSYLTWFCECLPKNFPISLGFRRRPLMADLKSEKVIALAPENEAWKSRLLLR